MKDVINKLVEKDDSVSLKQLTEKINLMRFEVSKESIRKHLISEEFKSLAPVEAYELTNEQKKRRVEWCKENTDFDWNNVIFRCDKKKKRRWMKEESKNITSIRKHAKKVDWWGGIYKWGRLSLKLFTNNMNSEFYANILDEKCLEMNKLSREYKIDWIP